MDSTTTKEFVEEREALMVFPSETSEKTHLLKPCFTPIDGSEAVLPRHNCSASSPPDLKALPSSVSFHGWRFANTNFKSWARKMAGLHELTWRKAGIFEAIMASTYRIYKNTDLLLGIAEKWCPDTKTFVFPWGETSITLEDVMVLLGFSVLGLPVFATLDSPEMKKIQRNLEKEWLKIKIDKVSFVRQVPWVERFMDSGDELEHVAFLVLWLSYFVFPSRYYHISEDVLPIAVHLSRGTRIALAPAVLAHLYAELSLLKTHINGFTKSSVKIELGSMFKLVQLWTWERFKELRPKPNPILKGEPRLVRWYDLRQTNDVRQILDKSKIDSFEWRPYTIAVRKWNFPKFYPEKAMQIPVGPNLDDEFISYARCINVSELVGIDCVEHYFPNRVASQFGILQKVPCLVNRKNLSKEAAWNDYNKPIDDLTLCIPSRSALPCVTPTFSEWWRKSFPKFQYSSKENQVSESAETSESRKIIGDGTSFVPSGSKMNRRSEDGLKIAEDSTKERRKYMKRGCVDTESTIARCQKQVQSNNDEVDVHVTIAQMARLSKKKHSDVKKSGGDASEPLGKRSRLEADNNDSGHLQKFASINKMCNHLKQARDKRHKHMKQVPSDNDNEDDSLTIPQMRLDKNKCNDVKKIGGDVSEPLEADNNDPSPLKKLLASLGADGDETVSPPEIEETNETGSKTGVNMFLSPFVENNASDVPLAANGGVVDIGVSPPQTRRKEPEYLLHGDGAMAGEKASNEKLCIEAEKEDDGNSLIQKKLGIEELALKVCSSQKLAAGGATGDETSMGLSSYDETNTSDPPVVLPPETRETCNDELDVYSTKEPECLLQEDEKLCGEAEKEDDFVADGRIPMVVSPSDESNIPVNVGDGNQRKDGLVHENGLGISEKSNDGVGNDSYGKSLHELKVMVASLQGRIKNAQRNVAWLKERNNKTAKMRSSPL